MNKLLTWPGGCLLALIGRQLGVAGGLFGFGGEVQAGLDLHEGGSWGGLGLIQAKRKADI